MKKWGSLDVAGRAGQHRKPAAARIGRPTKQRSRNQNGCAARSADKNVGVAGLEARSTRAMKSSHAAKNWKRRNTLRQAATNATRSSQRSKKLRWCNAVASHFKDRSLAQRIPGLAWGARLAAVNGGTRQCGLRIGDEEALGGFSAESFFHKAPPLGEQRRGGTSNVGLA